MKLSFVEQLPQDYVIPPNVVEEVASRLNAVEDEHFNDAFWPELNYLILCFSKTTMPIDELNRLPFLLNKDKLNLLDTKLLKLVVNEYYKNYSCFTRFNINKIYDVIDIIELVVRHSKPSITIEGSDDKYMYVYGPKSHEYFINTLNKLSRIHGIPVLIDDEFYRQYDRIENTNCDIFTVLKVAPLCLAIKASSDLRLWYRNYDHMFSFDDIPYSNAEPYLRNFLNRFNEPLRNLFVFKLGHLSAKRFLEVLCFAYELCSDYTIESMFYIFDKYHYKYGHEICELLFPAKFTTKVRIVQIKDVVSHIHSTVVYPGSIQGLYTHGPIVSTALEYYYTNCSDADIDIYDETKCEEILSFVDTFGYVSVHPHIAIAKMYKIIMEYWSKVDVTSYEYGRINGMDLETQSLKENRRDLILYSMLYMILGTVIPHSIEHRWQECVGIINILPYALIDSLSTDYNVYCRYLSMLCENKRFKEFVVDHNMVKAIIDMVAKIQNRNQIGVLMCEIKDLEIV